ncbi:hypothetical protein TSAR_012429 [Trichomalopsis sarcophagae]|uniref:Transposable element P transposase n=1 Tax=Trichomalopsis sarcophagae TaxID=543379 RepID=A0A232ETL5_9HYME|nr:hypothetical protein TSAR_012429 [Trichomalopsis sarcophagae]
MAKQHEEELKALKNKYENALKQVFTPGQIKKLFNPTKKIRWNSEDISAAISLKSISSRGYRYLRNTVKLPLPAVSTLRRWISQLNFSPGILKNVLKIMEVAANSYHPIEKLVVLSFDEIYLSHVAAIDRKLEQKIGPHERCQVVMARGLFKSWKQPVYYDYDQSMTSEILLNIIKQLYECGFTVVATVCDLGPSNRKAFNDLGCPLNDPESCFFSHPCDESLLVHVFFDIPHLIKLLRNHFLDHGFFIDDSLIDKSIFEKLLLINDTELNLIHKLTQAHLEVTQSERQKVKPAVQLFSNRSAKAILYCYEKGWLNDSVCPLASSCIKIINDWFDLFNTKLKFEKNKTDAYGLDLDRQNAILHDMSEFIKDLRVGNHKNLIDCQKGILRNNASLKSLFTYLKNTYSTENFEIEYLLTFRLNQDILENLFSYLRAMGAAHDHPSALDIKNRLRLYILGKYSTNLFSLGTNTEAVESEEKFIQVDDEIMTRIFFDGTDKNNDDITVSTNINIESEMEVESEQTEFDTNTQETIDLTLQNSSSVSNVSNSLITDDFHQEHPLKLSLEDNVEDEFLYSLFEDDNKFLNNCGDENCDNDDHFQNDENVDNLNLETQNEDVCTDLESLRYIRQQINEEGLKYVVGYIAHRFRYKYPFLGNKTGPFIVGTPCPDWVTFLSRGGLLMPSAELLTIANIHEECFNSFHGLTDLSAEPFIFRKVARLVRLKLTDKLNDFIPEIVLNCLVRTRTYIRLRQINKNSVEEKSRKKIKKLKKLNVVA